MAEFKDALPYVLLNEGGWADDPMDPGGATMHGITFGVAQQYGIKTKDELRNITPELVERIYRSGYWRFNDLVSQRVATKIFDMCVNMGLRTGIRLAQETVNSYGATIADDGIWGDETKNAINAMPEAQMLDGLCHACVERYREIVMLRPASSRFLKGWMARAGKVPHA